MKVSLLYPVDGDREIDAVFADVEKIIEKVNLPTETWDAVYLLQVRCFIMIEFVSPTSLAF